MKKILFLFLMIASLFGTLLALDTGQMETDGKASKSINVASYDAILPINDVADAKINIWHRDTLIQGGDNGLYREFKTVASNSVHAPIISAGGFEKTSSFTEGVPGV